MDSATLLLGAILVLVAFVPSLLWAMSLRKGRRPVSLIASILMFVWGASIAIAIALVLEIVAPDTGPRIYFVEGSMWLPVIIAPLSEEFAKGLGLVFFKGKLTAARIGAVLGAFSGLGFSATENLLYELGAMQGGLASYILVAVLRSVAACLLHASASAVLGSGYAWHRAGSRSLLWVLPFYVLAVLIHGTYNYLVGSNHWGLAGFLLALVLVLMLWALVKKLTR